MKNQYPLIVVALPAEARPLNRHFGLTRDNSIGAFPLYRKSDMTLVISGVGCKAAYRTVCRLHRLLQPPSVLQWLNIGIAGHPCRHIGQAVLAREIRYDKSMRRWFSQPPTDWDSDLLISRSEPETHYPLEALYDMEAAGFFKAASRFAPPDLIHSLKIISDNRKHSVTDLNGKQVSRLIREQLNTIERLLQQLENSL